MTVWQLANDRYQMDVMATGGEVSRIRDQRTGREWLWQPQPGVWNNSATQLFPVVGRLIHDGIRENGLFFPLPSHGFLRYQHFERIEQGGNHMLLEARPTPETLAAWPWHWRFQLQLTVHQDGVSISQRVFNDDTRPFWFSLGWHPGFSLPVVTQPGWSVQFGDRAVRGPFLTSNRTLITEGQTQTTTLFPLTNESFRAGAVYFGNCRQVRVCSPEGRAVITLDISEYDWLALWSVPGANLLCIEPLAGTTDAPDFDGEIEQKRGIRKLMPGQQQTFALKLCLMMDV